jgi:glutathione synthase/RimK-type ligase-like ATP-grasp enzyme
MMTADDALAVAALRERGHTIRLLPWRSVPLPDDLDMVIVRSCWDYAQYQSAFLEWCRPALSSGVALWNSFPVLNWNIDKRYLLALEAAGVTIIPTRIVESGAASVLRRDMEDAGWDEVVIKPVVGAAGADTHRIQLTDADAFQESYASLCGQQAMMIQPFVADILKDGEWSFLFFDGVYSHAIRKFAKAGEFRVQDDHGGTVKLEVAPVWLQQQAQDAHDALPFVPLYARVDGVVVDGQLWLMEVELIEPELFFRGDGDAPGRFADAVERKMHRRVIREDMTSRGTP